LCSPNLRIQRREHIAQPVLGFLMGAHEYIADLIYQRDEKFSDHEGLLGHGGHGAVTELFGVLIQFIKHDEVALQYQGFRR